MECVVRVSSRWRGEHEFSKINAQRKWGSFKKHSGKNRQNQIGTEFADFRNGESGLDWSSARRLDRTSTPPKKLSKKWYSIPETEYDEFAVSAEIKLPDKHLILKYLRHMQLSIAYLRFLELLSFDQKLLRKYPVFGIVLKIYIVVLYFVIYIAIGSFMNSKQQYIFYLTLLKSLAQTTKFSLTSSLGSFPACSCVQMHKYFSQQFSLTSFNCSCVQLKKFSLTWSRAQTTKFSLTSFRPWQVLFVRVYDINCQVLPWQGALFKSRHDQLLNKAPC